MFEERVTKDTVKVTKLEILSDLPSLISFEDGTPVTKENFDKRRDELAFDEHYLKALIAPRVFFSSEAAGDLWANPVGTYVTNVAAKPVFELLGAPENLLWYWRHGSHYHEIIDVKMLVSVIKHKKYGDPLDERMFDMPFDPKILDK